MLGKLPLKNICPGRHYIYICITADTIVYKYVLNLFTKINLKQVDQNRFYIIIAALMHVHVPLKKIQHHQ